MLSLQRISFRLVVKNTQPSNLFFIECALNSFIYYPWQEFVDVGNSDKWAKVPPCNWSAIPPPELRGEAFEDLSTNGGFFIFGILLSYNNYPTNYFLTSHKLMTQTQFWTLNSSKRKSTKELLSKMDPRNLRLTNFFMFNRYLFSPCWRQ